MSISVINPTRLAGQLSSIEKSLAWEKYVPVSDKLNYRQKLINLHRELNKIKFAVDERPSVAVFGESQMGKSYLVSAIMSTPDRPFKVTSDATSYNFIDDINPSSPNSTIEATGVITRFTTNQQTMDVPKGFLRAQLLSVSDIVLILSEAYYNQVDYSHESLIDTRDIDEFLGSLALNKEAKQDCMISSDDVLNMREYLLTSSIQKKCPYLLNSHIFDFLLTKKNQLDYAGLISVLNLFWNRNKELSRVFGDLMKLYQQLSYSSTVFVEFDAVLRKYGTLLDVARLDEMYASPDITNECYRANVTVKLSSGTSFNVQKSFLSALIAELCFILPDELCVKRPFLKDLDILDFPGARRPEQIKEDKLNEGKNLSTIIRRGKVSYLFNKYSSAKRIATLIFCHNNNQSAESTMGALLNEWINYNIGNTPVTRSYFIKQAQLSPLFIVGTWFNKDLEYQGEQAGDVFRLNERWQRRFNVVLEKEVLKSLGDKSHWFNNWTTDVKNFHNIYMLRDFKYSTTIFDGYDPDNNKSEEKIHVNNKYPDFMKVLRKSFITNEFVKNHFVNPSMAWDEAASVGKDGTGLIIKSLDMIAPHVTLARNEKFLHDAETLDTELCSLLEQYYHPETNEEQLKQAKRQAGTACLQIETLMGSDPYFFGKMMNTLMLPEADVYELLHQQLLGEEQTIPMSNAESNIFMSAALDTSVSREENIKRLCAYLGVQTEDECKEILVNEKIDIEHLLSQTQMLVGKADDLVNTVEKLWHDQFLAGKCVAILKDRLPAISNILANLWNIYKIFNVHAKLVKSVNAYLQALKKEDCVGILADYLAVTFNTFVNTFGYIYLSDEDKQKLKKQNQELCLGLNLDELEDKKEMEGVMLLKDLYTAKEQLANSSFDVQKRQLLLKLPQYSQKWCWEQRLRLGFLYSCQLPDYDTKANEELKQIIETIKN